MEMLWDKFQWILPLYMKPISFQIIFKAFAMHFQTSICQPRLYTFIYRLALDNDSGNSATFDDIHSPGKGSDVTTDSIDLWPLLLTWFNFNPSMDK